jgi:cell fate (sporulation/competence/biofilm development) regulator YlbF (YheA/YmcA/DUF963 family)
MAKEINSALFELKVRARKKRTNVAVIIVIIVFLSVSLFLIGYYSRQIIVLAIGILIMFFGGLYIAIKGTYDLIYPLEPEYRAFREIAEAIEALEKSNKEIAYKEAYRDVEKAYVDLSSLSLSEGIAWYKATNDILKKFLEDLNLIVLPAIKGLVIKKEHLKELALAIYSLDPVKLNAVNETLEAEFSYAKTTIMELGHEGTIQKLDRLFRTYVILKDAVIIVLFFLGCAAFYFVMVDYGNFQRGQTLDISVVAFLGLLTIYYTSIRKPHRA